MNIKNCIFSFMAISSFLVGGDVAAILLDERDSTPYLMLHFDINKTLIASDRAGGKSTENVLNQLLSAKYQDCWDSSIEEAISYDDYVRNVLFPGPEYDLELKKQRKNYLDHFVGYLRERNHPFYPECIKTYNAALKVLQNSKGDVFPSFYRLLEELERRNISYKIILRSFGEEVFEIAEEINANYKDIITNFGSFKKGTLILDSHEVGCNPTAIYEALRSAGHAAIRDDWQYWMEGNMDGKFGKPFFLDQSDNNTLSFFFDDNIYLDDREKNIVAPIDAKTGKPIAIAELAALHRVICVDTLEAILNERYFVNLIQREFWIEQQAIQEAMAMAVQEAKISTNCHIQSIVTGNPYPCNEGDERITKGSQHRTYIWLENYSRWIVKGLSTIGDNIPYLTGKKVTLTRITPQQEKSFLNWEDAPIYWMDIFTEDDSLLTRIAVVRSL